MNVPDVLRHFAPINRSYWQCINWNVHKLFQKVKNDKKNHLWLYMMTIGWNISTFLYNIKIIFTNGSLTLQCLNGTGSWGVCDGPNSTVTCHQQPRPLTCCGSSECSGTRSYETTSRDQRGKIEMFFSSTGACTATKSPIANHRSSIVAQLYFASVTQMFLMPLFVKVESGSSKLLRTVSKSGPNGCKERSRPQKMLMRIKIESFLGRQNI